MAKALLPLTYAVMLLCIAMHNVSHAYVALPITHFVSQEIRASMYNIKYMRSVPVQMSTEYEGVVSSNATPYEDTADEEKFMHTKNESGELKMLKDKLLRLALGTNRGFSTRTEERESIYDVVRKMEVLNPNPSPNNGFSTRASPLEGKWQLLFTDAIDILSLLLLPGVSIGQIYQNIGSDGSQIENIVELQPFLAPLIPSTLACLTVKAKGQVVSPVRLSLSFQSTEFSPETFFGNQVNSIFLPAKFEFPKALQNVGWLEHSFVDEDIRVGRSYGNVFILLRTS